MKSIIIVIISLVCLNYVQSQTKEIDLLKSINSKFDLDNVRDLYVEVNKEKKISVKKKKPQTKIKYAWFGIPVSSKGQQFTTSEEIEATIKNTSDYLGKFTLCRL